MTAAARSIEVAVAAFLGLWFVLSLLEQIRVILRPLLGPVRALDLWIFRVSPFLPRWTFFAPNPGTVDYHLCYRHELRAGEVTSWREALVDDDARFGFVWNPRKRLRKTVMDLVAQLGALTRALPEEEPNPLVTTLPYLLLLHHVSALPAPPNASGVQFCVSVAMNGAAWPRQIQPALLSNMHRLKAADASDGD